MFIDCIFKVEAAVTAAQNAFPGWSAKSPQERSKIMSKLADLIEENLESFAQAESKDQGKGENLLISAPSDSGLRK